MVSGRPYKVPMRSASQFVTCGWEGHRQMGFGAGF